MLPAAVPALAENKPNVSLDTSETLFSLLTAINTCGYDQELNASDPLRGQIRAEVRKAVRRQRKLGADFIKIVASGGVMTPRSNPRASQYSVPELRAGIEEAKRLGTYATAHALSTTSIAGAIDAGIPMIEHAGFFAEL